MSVVIDLPSEEIPKACFASRPGVQDPAHPASYRLVPLLTSSKVSKSLDSVIHLAYYKRHDTDVAYYARTEEAMAGSCGWGGVDAFRLDTEAL